jgi:hypothetical protein
VADDHKTVVLSILSTLLAAVVVFVATVAFSGGVSLTLFDGYVLPLLVTSFSLAVFAGVLFARNKGKIPGFQPDSAKENEAEAPKA